jgi:hypothetical protein
LLHWDLICKKVMLFLSVLSIEVEHIMNCSNAIFLVNSHTLLAYLSGVRIYGRLESETFNFCIVIE